MEQSSQGSFVSLGKHDILTTAIGTKEHPGRVRTAGSGVGIRQYFGPAPRSSSSMSPQMMEELVAQLRTQVTNEVRDELRREFDQKLESMDITQ